MPRSTSPEQQARIDEILHKCSMMRANLGTKTPLDVGNADKAKALEQEWLREIKDIDPVQYKMLAPDRQE